MAQPVPESGPAVTSLAVRCERCGVRHPFDGPHACSAAGSAASSSPDARKGGVRVANLVGALLGDRYEIEGELTQGGMGVVYKGQQLSDGRPVAVKVLRGGVQVPGAQRRFLNEARLLGRIDHPNIVAVLDSGLLPDGRNFLVMEFLTGSTLAQALKAGRMETARACRIALQLVRGLLVIHGQGIVHRDLKPENIFLIDRSGPGAGGGEPDFVKIIDFGIAKITTDGDAKPVAKAPAAGGKLGALADESVNSENARTKPGTALGSPRYMAPEQVRGADVDARTDQYALGCMLYQMLTGQLPFDAPTPIELMMQHVNRPPPPLRRPGVAVPPPLEQAVLRMMAKSRDERFPSLAEVEPVLLKYARASADPRRWRWVALLLLPLLLGLGLLLAYRLRHARRPHPTGAQVQSERPQLDGGQPQLPDSGSAPAGSSEPAHPAAAADVPAGPQGQLVIDAPVGTLFQLDAGPWQRVSGQPLPVAAGPHRITTLGGNKKATIIVDKTATVRVKPARSEELARQAREAFERGDSRKGQRLSDKLNSLCARDRKHPQACQLLTDGLSGSPAAAPAPIPISPKK